MIKLSDYIMKRLVQQGIKDVFMISGGGDMHLVDSLGKETRLNYLCPHHEQSAAIAAEGYARVSGKLGTVIVTSGPGGTNTLTGVIGQWLDSIPCLYLSGQVKRETTLSSCPNLHLRQLGDQEINIVDIMRPVTKYAVMIRDPLTIRYHLEKAMYLATHGRPGPVWLDIPLDVQAAMIDERKLRRYDPRPDEMRFNKKILKKQVGRVIDALNHAQRPVLLAGHGIGVAAAQPSLLRVLGRLSIPVVTSFNGFDVISTDHAQFVGRIGTLGGRAGNFAVQNADLLLSVGSRNNIRQISYNWKAFARGAKKIIVDIDKNELLKPTLKPDLPIHCDAGLFLEELYAQLRGKKIQKKKWLQWCRERREKYPPVVPNKSRESRCVEPYHFIHTLSQVLPERQVVVCGNGTACVAYHQAGIVKKGQKAFWNSGCASMGYDLPASIGACLANQKKSILCLTGDGSIQMNLQELQSIVFYKLPIKIFVLDNRGYVSIRQTQDNFFSGRYVGSDEISGVSIPDMKRIACVYGFKVSTIDSARGMKQRLAKMMNAKGNLFCVVRLPKDYIFQPKNSSERLPDGRLVSKPLEDMYPFLPRAEFRDNMIIEPLTDNVNP